MGIKQKIIEQINSIEDISVLEEIYSLVSNKTDLEKAYKFSKDELTQVNEAIEDADNNRYYTQRESEKLIAD